MTTPFNGVIGPGLFNFKLLINRLIACTPGLTGICFAYTLSSLDVCQTIQTSTPSLNFDTKTLQPFLITQTHLFSLLYKISACLTAYLSILLTLRSSGSHKSALLWSLVLVLGLAASSEFYLLSFNRDSLHLQPSLLYLPLTSEEFLIEHFGDIHMLVELYKPAVPVLMVTLACLVVCCLFRGRGRESDGVGKSDLVFVVVGIVRLLCLPVLFLVHEVCFTLQIYLPMLNEMYMIMNMICM